MDTREKQELADALLEMKELIDEVLPIESSVVRDQVLVMLMASAVQAKFAAKHAAPLPPMLDFTEMATKLKDAAGSTEKTVAATLVAAASRLSPKRDSPESAEMWAWEAFQYILERLRKWR
jgi:hypothetical protein